jgi:hypothetical protein
MKRYTWGHGRDPVTLDRHAEWSRRAGVADLQRKHSLATTSVERMTTELAAFPGS